MTTKFKIGDHVIFTGEKCETPYRGVIVMPKPSKDGSSSPRADDDKHLILMSDQIKMWVSSKHIELDKQYYREERLNNLLNDK